MAQDLDSSDTGSLADEGAPTVYSKQSTKAPTMASTRAPSTKGSQESAFDVATVGTAKSGFSAATAGTQGTAFTDKSGKTAKSSKSAKSAKSARSSASAKSGRSTKSGMSTKSGRTGVTKASTRGSRSVKSELDSDDDEEDGLTYREEVMDGATNASSAFTGRTGRSTVRTTMSSSGKSMVSGYTGAKSEVVSMATTDATGKTGKSGKSSKVPDAPLGRKQSKTITAGWLDNTLAAPGPEMEMDAVEKEKQKQIQDAAQAKNAGILPAGSAPDKVGEMPAPSGVAPMMPAMQGSLMMMPMVMPMPVMPMGSQMMNPMAMGSQMMAPMAMGSQMMNPMAAQSQMAAGMGGMGGAGYIDEIPIVDISRQESTNHFYFPLAICSCVCNPILGLLALLFAYMANENKVKGNHAKHTSYVRTSMVLSFVAIAATIAVVVAVLGWYLGSQDPVTEGL